VRSGPVDRRSALKLAAVAAAATAAGCSSSTPVVRPTPSRSPSATPLPARSPDPPPAPELAPVAPWSPSGRESLPALKLAAAGLVQAVCTRRPGQTVADAFEPLAAALAPGFDGSAALRTLAPLGEGAASTGEVLYPQLGGLVPIGKSARSACVMVVVRQRILSAGGSTTSVTRTVDVRLFRDGDRWQVTAVPSVGGEPVARPADLPPAAVRVLDDPRLALPDTARWDVHAGRVSLDLLDLLADAVEVLGRVGVTVLVSGHPPQVYGTATVSAHAVGRAADVWQVTGVTVVDDRSPGGPTAQLQAAALLDRRTSQVGSPPGTDRDGRGRRRSFADLVHEDHLHLAVRR
jgi:hypothetical protein